LMAEVQEERAVNRKERLKNKRFRKSVWAFLGRLASCFSLPPTDLPTYETSPEPSSPDTVDDEPPRRPGKAPVVEQVSDDDEEEHEHVDDSDDTDEEAVSGSPGGSNEAAEDDDRSD